ncbi:MAG: hypothetical protein JWQ71_2818 [Pedosphaera sp.]|nr:hypothetical protein [Pedosphaera sp.]
MKDESGPLTAERSFFEALLAGNVEKLKEILADDFILIDVMSGSEITKVAMLEVMGSGQLKFDAIERGEPRVRSYGATAVITGRTQMKMRFGEAAITTKSRYTHVYVEQAGQWRLVTAQGTQIAGE